MMDVMGPDNANAWSTPQIELPSHVSGSIDEPLVGMTIGQALALTAAKWPARDALVSHGQSVRLSWSELLQAADEFAAGLLVQGLQPRARIGLWAMNAAEWVVAQMATARAGLVLVTINPAYRVAELSHVLTATRCRAIIVGPPYKTSNYAAMVRELLSQVPDTATRQDRPPLDLVIAFGCEAEDGFVQWQEIAERGRAADPELLRQAAATVRIEDPVNIQFTSGTTGLPKGVALSHRNILNNGWFAGKALAACRT